MIRDLRFALRAFARMPAFTLLSVATLALGVGATTAIFSVVNAVLLRPLPFVQPDRLVVTRGSLPDFRRRFGGATVRGFDGSGVRQVRGC
jgi:hypothetical protein